MTRVRKMEGEFRYGQMVLDTMAFGLMVRHKDLEGLCMPKVMCMRVNGLRTRHTVMASILISMAHSTLAIGFLTSNKV